MPTYEYQCGACGQQVEIFQKITDEPLTECPKCHAAALSKIISATNFQLKGTGWYVTDIRDKGKPKPAESPSSTESKSGDSSSSSGSKTE